MNATLWPPRHGGGRSFNIKGLAAFLQSSFHLHRVFLPSLRAWERKGVNHRWRIGGRARAEASRAPHPIPPPHGGREAFDCQAWRKAAGPWRLPSPFVGRGWGWGERRGTKRKPPPSPSPTRGGGKHRVTTVRMAWVVIGPTSCGSRGSDRRGEPLPARGGLSIPPRWRFRRSSRQGSGP